MNHTVAILTPFAAAVVIALVFRKLAHRRADQEWAAGAAERVRTAEYLAWLELRFIDMEAEERS